MCLVSPAPEGAPFNTPRPCEPGGEKYVPIFQTLHDDFPPALQKMFCSLEHIYVEKDFIGTAWAGLHPETGVADIGIRQTALEDGIGLHQWASWKEQLSFGGSKQGYVLTAGLPFVSTRTPGVANDFLVFVIAHEFGHLFDFANRLNAYDRTSCVKNSEGEPECRFLPGTWGSISWKTTLTPRPHNQFHRRGDLCFYWCEDKKIPFPEVSRLYRELYYRSEFISTYGATNYGDDFAEAIAYYVLDRKGARYFVDTTAGEFFDPMAKLRSPVFRAKWRYLQRFMHSPITYP